MPSSPEEAIRQQNERISRGETSRVVDVYESDGVTKIDTFTIQAPNETTNN